MKRFTVFNVIIFAVVVLTSCSTQKFQNRKNLTVVFYNVENLFDTINEPGKTDGEFTPNGQNKWTDERYNKKVDDIARVLGSINVNDLPEIIGLCEIENRKVLEDLVSDKFLARGLYRIVHYESPDNRGIDCAFLYRQDEFEVIASRPVHVSFAAEPNFHTRDILYIKGRTLNGEEMHIFVNHWPSRIGGEEQTENARVSVATLLKSKIDSVQKEDPMAEIIVMGDMNDEPSNKSLDEVLGASKPGNKNNGLVNLMYPVYEAKQGSYYYRGNWNMLDNLVVSSNLLDDKGFCCTDKLGHVFHQDWMEYKNTNGVFSPNRTYGGSNYYGGVSDHFPVYISLKQ